MQKHPGTILVAPHITEKGAFLAEQGCYVFEVAKSASKAEVARAIQEVYQVVPRKVTLAAISRKQVIIRGTNRKGETRGGKKAHVFLKSGDKIELA